MANFGGYKFDIAARLGNAANIPALQVGIIAYDMDTKTFRVGDDTSTPSRFMGDKSSGTFDFPNVGAVRFNDINVYPGKKVAGADVASMVKADGFPYHQANGAFINTQIASANGSLVVGAPAVDPTNPNRYILNIGIKQEYLDILLSGFNLSDVGEQGEVPTDLGDPIIYVNETYYIWNTETNSYNTLGIPVLADNFPTAPGPNLYIDASDTDDHKLRMWSGQSYVYVGGGNEVYVGDVEPTDPAEGMWWRRHLDNSLSARVDHEWLSLEFTSLTSENALSRNALWESWRLNDEGFRWENFVDNARFNQREFDAMAATTTANDDTIGVVSSYPFVVGSSYAIFTANGLVEEITILAKPSATTIRATTTIGTTLNVGDNAKIGPTSFVLQEGYATVQGNGVYYSKNIDVLSQWNKGVVLIRRDASGTGLYNVYYRETGTDPWIRADMIRSQGVKHDPIWSEELYTIDINRTNYDVRITFDGDVGVTENIKHIVFYTDPQQADDLRVEKPTNVSPAHGAVNIDETPTLTLSDFLSLYGIAQGGAQFQVSEDSSFYNVVIDTSSEPLISWIAVAGNSAAFNDALMYGDRLGITVGDAAFIGTTDDGGETFTTRTSAIATQNINAVAYNGTNRFYAAGNAGSIQHSVNGTAWVAAAGVDSFTGVINGIAATASYGIAVGATGKILISSNNGVIWASATTAGGYSGTFQSVCLNSIGRAIAVGASGAIQTSPDYGVTWVQRTPAGSFSGTFNDVAMTEDGYAVAVGASGAIQTSSDFGSTWVQRTAADSYAGAFQRVAINGQTIVAVGATGAIQTSYNRGQTWYTRHPAGASVVTFKGIALNSDNYAFIVGSGGTVQHTLALEGVAGTSYTVPEGLDLIATNHVYYWRGRLQDSIGYWSEWSDATAFATQSVFQLIGQPTNVLPASGAVSVPLLPNLVSTVFTTGADNPDTHASSQWQISESSEFLTTVYDSGVSSDLLIHTVASSLPPFSTLFWRVRHYGTAVGAGPWSIPSSFRVSSVPNAPSVTAPVNGSTNVSIAPLLKTSVFSNVDAGVSHYATQFQVSTSAGFASIAYDSGAVISATPTQFSVPTGTLSASTIYYVRARHKGANTEWSAWSTANAFTTNNVGITKPVFSYSGLTPTEIGLKSNAFTVFGSGANDVHASTDWEIYKVNGVVSTLVWSSYASASKTSITVAKTALTGGELTGSEYYKARVRHNGTGYGSSEWSDYNANSNFTYPAPTGVQEYTTPGSFTFLVPANVYTVSALVVAAGSDGNTTRAGSGGGLAYKNDIAVLPGQSYSVIVGARGTTGGTSSFGSNLFASGGTAVGGAAGGSYDGGYSGGTGGAFVTGYGGGGGSAARYNTAGGNGMTYTASTQSVPVTTSNTQVVRETVSTEAEEYYSYNRPSEMTSGDVNGTGPYPSTYWERIYEGSYTYTVSTGISGGEELTHNSTVRKYKYTKTYYRWVEQTTNTTTYVSQTTYTNVQPTGTAGAGRGGLQGLIGEVIGLTGSNTSPGTGYGAGGAGPNGLGKSGAVRIIWGSGKSYPSNAA